MRLRLVRPLVLGMALTTLAASMVSAESEIDAGGRRAKGTFGGTWEATAGQLNGQEGRVTFKIKKAKKQRGGAFILTGTGKFGAYQQQDLQGAYDPRSNIMTVLLYKRTTNPRARQHSLTLNFQGNGTWTGLFSITNIRRENIGGGNVTISKKR